jgi:hypothetical protein
VKTGQVFVGHQLAPGQVLVNALLSGILGSASNSVALNRARSVGISASEINESRFQYSFTIQNQV